MNDKLQIPRRKKIAFVCSGGATKAAAFHMGVGLALQEKGFRFLGGLKSKQNNSVPRTAMDVDAYVGSSAGSVIAAYLAAGYSLDQIFNAYMGKKKQSPLKPLSYSALMSVKSSQHEEVLKEGLGKRLRSLTTSAIDLLYRRQTLLSLQGLFTTAGIESYMREVLPSNRYQDYASDLCIVATQLNHSKRVIFSKHALPAPPDDPRCLYETQVAISDSVAASVALPPIFAPYGIRNHNGKIVYFFDGEIRETLSVNAGEQLGADLVIASYTHQPYHFSREVGSLTKFGITAIGIQAIYLLIERKIQSAIYNRNQKLAALEAVSEYCKSASIDEKQRKKILSILEENLAVKPDNRYIYINPRPRDHEMFFGDHFNFSSRFMEKIVRIGFMSAIETLRKYEFEK